MTPAEVLAAAADKLDALVADASPGPWRDMLMGSEGSTILAGGSTVSTARRVGRMSELDAPYIAAMNPLVGQVMAELLRRQAEQMSRLPVDTQVFICDREHGGYGHGLALARLIIGGKS